MSVLNRFEPIYKGEFLADLCGVLSRKQDITFLDIDQKYISLDFYGNILPREGCYSDYPEIYYFFSKFIYENPIKFFKLKFFSEFIDEQNQENNNILRLCKFPFLSCFLYTDFFGTINKKSYSNCNDEELQQKIDDNLIGGITEKFTILFDDSNEPEETDDEETVNEETDDEERQQYYRTEHQASLSNIEETNEHSAFEFTESDFEHFWENNTNNFIDGTFDITYGFLGIEEIKLRKENQEEVNHNKIKTFKSNQCVICTENQPNILFCNCGHLCMCNTCFIAYAKNQCPVCKTDNTIIREI